MSGYLLIHQEELLMYWILISEEKCIVDSINLFSLYLKHLKPELMRRLTRKERIIMEYYWTYGKMFIKDLQDKYPEPKPSTNTLSNQVRTLQADGFIDHKPYGTNFEYYPVVSREEYSKFGLRGIIDEFFNSSYAHVVSSFLKDDKITVDELKKIIEIKEKGKL
jgi:predicted transcriptional regulator